MTVRELIDSLSRLDPDRLVKVWETDAEQWRCIRRVDENGGTQSRDIVWLEV